MPEFDKDVDDLIEFFTKKIKQDEMSKEDTNSAIKAVGIVGQLMKDLHDIGDYVRSKKGQ